jgi:hypothetical protein
MKKNLGTIDKAARLLIAVIAVILYFTNVVTGTMGIVLLVVAGLMVVTSIAGICPLYLAFKLNTQGKK